MRKTVKTLAQTLSRPMYLALEFYGTDHTHDAVAYPTTGTRVALFRRGLLTTGYHAWDHTLTVDGESVLRTGLTVAEAFDLAVSINTAFTVGTDDGPASLDASEAALTGAELAEKIGLRMELLNAAIEAVRADWSPASNSHALGMVQAHAWWLSLYRAEVDRRSRELAVQAYTMAVDEGLARRGRLNTTLAAHRRQAVMDLLHGEAVEQFRAERPAAAQAHAKALFVAVRTQHWAQRGYGASEAAAFATWDWAASPAYSENPLVR